MHIFGKPDNKDSGDLFKEEASTIACRRRVHGGGDVVAVGVGVDGGGRR
jgi:hypothetical protein